MKDDNGNHVYGFMYIVVLYSYYWDGSSLKQKELLIVEYLGSDMVSSSKKVSMCAS